MMAMVTRSSISVKAARALLAVVPVGRCGRVGMGGSGMESWRGVRDGCGLGFPSFARSMIGSAKRISGKAMMAMRRFFETESG
jgi:hypothetical protein